MIRPVVVDTGVANLASVLAGLRRAGSEPVVSHAQDEVDAAELLVIPGVGAFGAGMRRLRQLGLVELLAARCRAERPLLAVCLGLQILCEESEESPGFAGLGVIAARVRRFEDSPATRVPLLGWNEIVPAPECELVGRGFGYYANSYRLETVPSGWRGATSDHGGPFVAALERGPMLACQFHPELSGAYGHELIARWLTRVGATGASC